MLDWPILVLTLRGDEARRQPLVDALTRIDLPYELFLGVDGRAGLPEEFHNLIDRDGALARRGKSMTDGEFACALSHRAMYQYILERGLPGAIILEDDAILEPGFAAFVRSGDYRLVPMVLMDFAFGRAIPFLRRKVCGGHLRKAAVQATVTTGYCVSESTARKLLSATTPVSQPADWPCNLYDLEAWLMVPRLVRHEAPGQRMSHLDRQRDANAAAMVPRQALSFAEMLRRRFSVRVGRRKGQR
ncbi:MAG: glycosyltransferase family 25 protein [Paracoccus sp. (in: a-proteobacteria)]|nr:glycosyltransferase family 25 protein [Paracoccus sp. (in: a-proteobacteria)]